jgi:hypothetical protein
VFHSCLAGLHGGFIGTIDAGFDHDAI